MPFSVRPGQYAVIFCSHRYQADASDGYGDTAARMLELAARQPGFIGVYSVREPNGFGITVSYWEDLPSIKAWREQDEHRVARNTGRARWYEDFQLQIARVEQAQEFARDEP